MADDALDLLRLRTRRLTDRRIITRGRDYVLCWLMQALRADENPALDAAIALGNARGLPVVVLHALENRYPYASHRIHRFILEASQELGPGVEARGLRFVRWVRREGESEVDLVARLAERAAAVVCDDVPTFVTREYADALADRLDRAVLGVDACCLVPMNAFEQRLGATKTFRAAHTPQRALHLATDLRQEPDVARFDGDLDIDSEAIEDLDGDGLDALIAETGVDMTVPPALDFRGHRSAALGRLGVAVEQIVGRYKWTRNNPATPDGTSKLSPWMHFGVLSPREVARAVVAAEEAGDVHPAARYKFLDETLTWREYYYHRCRWDADWSRFRGLPTWARETLAAHADDPRPDLRSLDALVHGETDDVFWNAAQKQFLLDGWMNNNLRMYWVKQILPWCAGPEAAFATACYLNDRFSLDGRDAATYGGIRWGFGDSKKAYRETEVYGWVPRKTSAALKKRDGVPAWIEAEAARPTFRAALPDDEAAALARYL
ncbi:MAG: deoxyribodipyrimidine photo-lyase [Rhodothermales bacterium]